MNKDKKRKLSAGTITVLAASAVIIALSVFVWIRLSSGKAVDLSKLRTGALELREVRGKTDEQPFEAEKKNTDTPTVSEIWTEAPAEEELEKSFTLTVSGTVALDGEVRKNSWYSDAKQYDYYDTMVLLKRELQTDLNIVFLENLLSEDGRSSDLTATNAAAAMLKGAGFNMAACGFSKAFEKEENGIQSTRKLLYEQGITPVGIGENRRREAFAVLNINGIKTAVLQYTDSIPAATRKKMIKEGKEDLVPAANPEEIAADIAEVRSEGCNAVIVLINWGKVGKTQDKAMKALAQKIADAGADIIIGNGSRIVSGAEILNAAETGRQVLCVWSLGAVLSGDRSNIKRMAGMMLKVTVREEKGNAEICDICYIPLYTWKYKQDSRFYYRCLASDSDSPDGMDTEQQKMMKKAADTVRSAMKNVPVEERSVE